MSSSKRGKWLLRDSKFQNFPGGGCPPNPPTTLAAMQLVGQTNLRPAKISWSIRLWEWTSARIRHS